MTRSASSSLATRSSRRTRAVSLPITATAILLIDVINDLAFAGSEVLVAQAEPMALRLALKGHVAPSTRLRFRGRGPTRKDRRP